MISVIIPTKNRPGALDSCIASLLAQSMLPDEVVVIDSSITNATHKVVSHYQRLLPIQYLFEKRIGIPYAMNTGVQKAKGDLLAFLNDDCKVDLDWIKNIKLQENSDQYIIQGKTLNANPESLIATVMYFLNEVQIQVAIRRALAEKRMLRNYPVIDFLDIKNAVISKNIIQKLNYFYNESFINGGDIELLFRLIKNNIKIIYVPSVIAHHNYTSSLRGATRRLYWSKLLYWQFIKKKQNQELTKLQNIFGSKSDKAIENLRSSRKKYLKKSEKDLLARFLREKSFFYKVGFVIVVTIFKLLK